MEKDWIIVFMYLSLLYNELRHSKKNARNFRELQNKISNDENLFKKVLFVNLVFSNPEEAKKRDMYPSFLKNHELFIEGRC
jgi:hypothetical protein